MSRKMDLDFNYPNSPNLVVKVLHSVPHVNITLHIVNDTFNPNSNIYIESLGILASIPAAILILALVGLLLYLLTRCCDRKPRKTKSQSCQKCTLITITLLCCAAIGLGLYGNDDFHNGILQAHGSGKQIVGMVANLTTRTEQLKQDIRSKILMSDIEDLFDKPAFNQTAVKILLDNVRMVKENTTRAVSSLETVLFMLRPREEGNSLKHVLGLTEKYESIRWPATLGFLTVLLLLCTILVIGVARSSRCALIFFSVFGLFGVIICWLLSGIYLSSSVALADFCMRPNDHLCRQVAMRQSDDVNFINCGNLRNRFILRLNESRDNIERARGAFLTIEVGQSIEQIERELSESKYQLQSLTGLLDRRNVEPKYALALKGLCGGGLLGLSLMMVASLVTAFLLTILVCVDSHTWIYLSNRRPYGDKSETTPFLNSSASTASPTGPILSGNSTINRTLLHHQQNQGSSLAVSSVGRNGTAQLRGLSSGHQTLGRLPSQTQSVHSVNIPGPNNGSSIKIENADKTDKPESREVPLNGFNRFDPKYVSIGPKALRDQHFGITNKCATLRHGGRYGGNLGLDKSQGPNPSPHLKKAQPPSVATKKSTMKYSDLTVNKGELDVKPQSTVYSIDTASSYRSPLPPPPPQQQQHLQLQQSNFSSIVNNKPKGISILNQPLPEIPQTTVQLPESSRNSHQPLSAANLNQYRSLQRPTPKSTNNPSRNIPLKEVTKPTVPHAKVNPPAPKVVPPMLPPKNRHKDDGNVRNKQNTQTLPTSKSQSLSQSQSRNHQSTHSTFGYDKGDVDKARN
ncbi:Protein tweety-2 [Pseudolycoriella hygida]|uniref:Protein tweety homolog n=1 Tax=Pseudolycoriella hygida TaxID=35572 RepID=A0A9Q0MQN3_9DIPT|nr:Protein tweety-2 [Pseudolycoriella hygida]